MAQIKLNDKFVRKYILGEQRKNMIIEVNWWGYIPDNNGKIYTITHLEGYNHSYEINWGDSDTWYQFNSSTITGNTHTYYPNGNWNTGWNNIHRITIRGTCESLIITDSGAYAKTVGYVQIGDIGLKIWRNGYNLNLMPGRPWGTDEIGGLRRLESFKYMFAPYSNNYPIPSTLLKYAVNVTDASYMFSHNVSIFNLNMNWDLIPADLLKYNTEITNVSYMFSNNYFYYKNPPVDFFKYNTKITNVHSTFNLIKKWSTFPNGIFNYNTEIIDTRNCFNNGVDAKMTGNADELWNTLTKIQYAAGCFRDCTSLSNYNDIPAAWKK